MGLRGSGVLNREEPGVSVLLLSVPVGTSSVTGRLTSHLPVR